MKALVGNIYKKMPEKLIACLFTFIILVGLDSLLLRITNYELVLYYARPLSQPVPNST